MGRSPCCSKVGLKRGPWSYEEDALLTEFIKQNGEGQWRSLPKKSGLLRCGKSCRLRWMNYLRPGIKRGNIDQDEEDLIVRLHRLLGNRWSLIAGRLPGRTDNEIKNHWNTHLLKKLNNAGIHPIPHKDLPKPPKVKKPTAASACKEKKKKKKKKQIVIDKLESGAEPNGDGERDEDVPKIKVYLPKPIRVSSSFSRTDSVDSLQLSGCSSTQAADKDSSSLAELSCEPFSWSMLELEDHRYEIGGGDDFLGGYCFLPLPSSDHCHDVITLDQVYDEYLSLL